MIQGVQAEAVEWRAEGGKRKNGSVWLRGRRKRREMKQKKQNEEKSAE